MLAAGHRSITSGFWSRSLSGLDSSAICGWSLLSWLTMPRNLLNSVWPWGVFIFKMASTFLGFICTPSESMSVPRNSTDGFESSHFSSFRVRLASCSLWRVASKCWLCSPTVLPYKRTSSIWQRAPSVPTRTCEIRPWKCSGAELIPNGRRLKQNLPNCEMKVMSLAGSGDKPIC